MPFQPHAADSVGLSPAPADRRLSIRALLMSLVLAALLPMGLLLAYSGFQSYRQAQQQAALNAFSLAQVTADSVEAFIDEARQMLATLSTRDAIRRMDPTRCDPVFGDFRRLFPQFASLSIANLDGELVCASSVPDHAAAALVRQAGWFRRVLADAVFVVAAPGLGPVTGRTVSVLAHPVRGADGQLVGTVQAPLDLLHFQPVVRSRNLPDTTVITVVDAAGTIVARSRAPERFVGSARGGAPIIDEVLRRHSGTAVAASSEGVERVYGFLPIAGTDWYAVAGIASHAVFATAREAAWRNTVVGLTIVVFASAIALALRRRIAAPILALRDAAQRVRAGALQTRAPTGGPAEVVEVAVQFNAMLDARAEQLRELASREADLRLLFDTSLEAILRLAGDDTVLEANPAACRLFRMDAAQLRGLGLQALVAAGDPRLQTLLDERAHNGRARGELRMRRSDGSRFEAEVSASQGVAADGCAGASLFVRDLSDRLLNEEMRAGKDAAELASREKSAFLARMSHELRTPLNAILGFTQLLETEPAVSASPQVGTMVGQVHKAGGHLLALIDDVLDLSRIEAGALSISPEVLPFEPIVQECVALTSSLALQHGIRVIVDDAPQSPVLIRADRTRVRQVLVNVLTNAIKYNREGGSVRLQTRLDDHQVRVLLHDTGWGLSAEQRAALFQPFNRLGAERSVVQGTGLGLVIVSQLLAAMGGRIEVDSTPGEGSCFTLVFPRGDAAPGPPAGSAPALAAAAPATPSTPAPPARPAVASTATVLCIEDHEPNVELVRAVLALRPHLTVETAGSGTQGIEMARRLLPALILLDVNLPDFDGYAVLRRLRADPRTAPIPCIALTANAMPGEAERAAAAGFAAYVVKPFSVSALLGRVDDALG